jgi:hypothetical protein
MVVDPKKSEPCPYEKYDDGRYIIDSSKTAMTAQMKSFGISIEGSAKHWKGIPKDDVLRDFPTFKRIINGWKSSGSLGLSRETKSLMEKNQIAWESPVTQKVDNFFSRIGHYADFVKKFHPRLYQYAMFFETDLISQFVHFLDDMAKKSGNTINNHCLEFKTIAKYEKKIHRLRPQIRQRCDNVIK